MPVENIVFRSELTWDGIIAILAIVLGIIATLGPFSWSRWRRGHPLQIKFSLEPYNSQEQRARRLKLAKNWQMKTMTGGQQMLLRISPHVAFNLRQVRVRFVERKWWPIWKWETAAPSVIRGTWIRDPFHDTAVSPLYYFDNQTDDPPDGSFLQGQFFNDHDPAKGVDVSQGDFIWLGIHAETAQEWTGRLQVEMWVNGNHVCERKRIRVTQKPKHDMEGFLILATDKAYP